MGQGDQKKNKLDVDELLEKILPLIVRHGVENLTFSQVSRYCNVPRSTLYYCFGNSFSSLLSEALRHGMKVMMQTMEVSPTERASDWHDFQLNRLDRLVSFVESHPWAPGLYFKFRNTPGELGESIQQIENQYIQIIHQAWTDFHGTAPDPQAVLLSCYLRLGLLWGLTQAGESWFGPQGASSRRQLLQHFTDITTRTMEMNFQTH